MVDLKHCKAMQILRNNEEKKERKKRMATNDKLTNFVMHALSFYEKYAETLQIPPLNNNFGYRNQSYVLAFTF